MKKILKIPIIVLSIIVFIILAVLALGMYKFNYLQDDVFIENKQGELINLKVHQENLQDIAKNGKLTIDEEEITLTNGVSSDSKIRYEGTYRILDTNGDGIDDIFYVVSQNNGDSDIFYYLAGQISSLDNYNGTYSLNFGENVKPQEIYINKKNNFVVKYLDRKPNEQISTKPSIEIEKEFGIYENEFYFIEPMDPSWDLNNDGVNDCEGDGTCDDSVDYSKPKLNQTKILSIESKQDKKIMVFNIGPYKKDCMGVAQMKCLVVNGGYFYEEVEGFEFKEGVRQKIEVERMKIKNPTADGGSYTYKFLKFI